MVLQVMSVCVREGGGGSAHKQGYCLLGQLQLLHLY